MAEQKEKFTFSDELVSYIKEWKQKRGNLIMVLHRVQQEFRYVPKEAAERVAEMLDVPLAKIYGVLTFYHYFKIKEPGEYNIQVCMGTACYLKGGDGLVEELENVLGVSEQEVTEDGRFSFESVRCVGCCGLAPVLVVGEEVYGKVTKDQIPGIIAKYQ